MRYKELLERKATLSAEIVRQSDAFHADNGGEISAERQTAWNKLNADYNVVCATLDREQRAAELGGHRAGGLPRAELGDYRGGIDRDRALAFQAWIGGPLAGFDITDEHREAARRCGVKLESNAINLETMSTANYNRFRRDYVSKRAELRDGYQIGATTMTVGTGSAGGSLVPPGEFLNSLEVALLAYNGVAQVAQTIITDDGEPLKWPTANDTGNTGELLAESADITGSGDHPSTAPTIGLPALLAYKFSAKPVLVTSELLQDSKFGLPGLLGEMLGIRLGRIGNTYGTTGTGTSQPQGITVGATAGVTAASTTTFTSDEIISLIHSVDPAYRIGAGFMANDLVLAFIRKMKDGEGRYLWQSGLQAGMPDTLLGYSITPNVDMNSTFTTGLTMLLFGKLSSFKIRRAGPTRIVRLNELYAATDQVAFNAYQRWDSRLIDAGTHPIKYLKLA
jgi:HK97 family phage major capsid protein